MTDEELPMLTSDFYAKHMLPAKPEGDFACHKWACWAVLEGVVSACGLHCLCDSGATHVVHAICSTKLWDSESRCADGQVQM